MHNSNRRKICIIGLDGVGLQNLKIFLSALPLGNISTIVSKGFTSSFTSIPPYTPSAWTNIFTGVNPGKHGIFGFNKVSRIKNVFRITMSSSYDVSYPRVFEMLALAGLRSVVINVPLVYPIQGLVGLKNIIVVSDWASPRQFIYPKRLEVKYKEYLIEPPHQWTETINVKGYRGKVEEFLERRLSMYYDILEQDNYSLFVIVFSELDWIMHRVPEVIEGKDISYISRIISLIDKFVKHAMELCDLVILTSDHGFQVARIFVGVNALLARSGFLSYKYRLDLSKFFSRLGLKPSESLEFRGERNEEVHNVESKSRMLTSLLRVANRLLPKDLLNKIEGIVPLRTNIDYSSSVAFMIEPGNWGVYVKKGFRDVVRKLFEGNRFIEKIISSHEIFWGPHLDRAPDIILIPRAGVFFDNRIYSQPFYIRYMGEHEPHALFALYGDGVLSNKDVSDLNVKVSIYDVIPTVLAYLNLPIPSTTDGRPLTELFNTELPGIHRKAEYISRFKIARKIRGFRAF